MRLLKTQPTIGKTDVSRWCLENREGVGTVGRLGGYNFMALQLHVGYPLDFLSISDAGFHNGIHTFKLDSN